MALTQRPAARFFAAFYRYSCHAHRPRPCIAAPHAKSSRGPASVNSLRCYHPARRPPLTTRRERGPVNTDTARHAAQLQLAQDMRRLMRKVPAAVVIITAVHHDPDLDRHVPMGTAVSSLTTVTLDPPTVSFNIKQPSYAFDAILAAGGRFRVHFLSASPISRAVVESFCTGNHRGAYAQRLETLPIEIPRDAPPRLLGEAVYAAAECTLTDRLAVHDHVVVVARIDQLDRGSPPPDLVTMSYLDGKYRDSRTAQVIDLPEPPTTSLARTYKALDRDRELEMAFSFPLFPGAPEREAYVQQLQAYVHNLRIPSVKNDLIQHLQHETRLVANAFGIDLHVLALSCRMRPLKHGQEMLPEFFGQLTAAQMQRLKKRAVELVKADARFLAIPYTVMLRHLDIHNITASVLPSDILDALRAEALVAPFQPRSSGPLPAPTVLTIFHVEQAEHILRQHLRTLPDKIVMRTSMTQKMVRAGLPTSSFAWFAGSHKRLIAETLTTYLDKWKIDISGDVSPEEACVIVRRLIHYLHFEDPRRFQFEAVSEILHKIRVDPLVTGINITYIIAALRHFAVNTPFPYPDPQSNIAKLLSPHFAATISLPELEARIAHFVRTLPLRAVSWYPNDQLAAMRLLPTTNLTGLPEESFPPSSTTPTISSSNLLTTLLAKALNNHYGHALPEHKPVIADFLRDTYGFDVVAMRAEATDFDAALDEWKARQPVKKPPRLWRRVKYF